MSHRLQSLFKIKIFSKIRDILSSQPLIRVANNLLKWIMQKQKTDSCLNNIASGEARRTQNIKAIQSQNEL